MHHANRFPAPATIIEALRMHAEAGPERPSFTYLGDGENPARALNYGELADAVERVARCLRERFAPGERVLLAHAGLDFVIAFFGCLRARVVAVPLPQLLRGGAAAAIAAGAGARVALASPGAPRPERWPEGMDWLPVDVGAVTALDSIEDPRAEDLAFLQYTSGSTRVPRGVMVGHDNLLANQRMIRDAFGHDGASTFVSWLPLFHDMGLIGTVIQPVFVGAHAVLMPPTSFLQRPARWLRAIDRFRAHTSGGPNFGYELCLRRINESDRANLDLSSWRVAFNGAEPVRADTLDRFAASFADRGFRRESFYPCYGLAEATLFVSGGEREGGPRVLSVYATALAKGEIEPGDGRRLVSCGRAWSGGVIAVADESGRPCGPDRVGTIFVAGPHVARGYWNDSAASTAFSVALAESGGRWLDTGDLGFLHDGELYITGRKKDLLILHGRNYYPQDIEQTVERSHPSLRPGRGAAFSIDGRDGECLVVVYEIVDVRLVARLVGPVDVDALRTPIQQLARRHDSLRLAPASTAYHDDRPALSAVASALRQAVAREHGLRVHGVALLRAGTLPRTSSGKVQRSRCRERWLAQTLDAWFIERAQEPDDAVPLNGGSARWLCSAVAQLLGVPAGTVDASRSLAELGLDSVAVAALGCEIERATGVTLSLPVLFEARDVNAIAAKLAQRDAEPVRSQRCTTAALSHQQRGLWFLSRLAPASTAYHVRLVARLVGPVDVDALRTAIQLLARRHDSLRMVFQTIEGEPVLELLGADAIALREIDASAIDERLFRERVVAEAERPFALDRGPLFRATLVRRGPDDQALVLAAHHTVADLWSFAILLGEVDHLYAAARHQRAATLPPVEATYADFVREQHIWLEGPAGAEARRYWSHALAEAAANPLDLPLDRPRPPVRSGRATTATFTLSRNTMTAVKALARREGATVYTVLLASLQVVLSRYTEQKSFVIGSPIWGRDGARWERVVGCFVNTVAVPAALEGDPSFRELIGRVRERVLAAIAHGNFPCSLIVRELQPHRDASHPPLLQVLFTMQSAPVLRDSRLAGFALGLEGVSTQLGDLQLHSIGLPRDSVDFDLDVAVAEDGDELRGYVSANADVFAPETAAMLGARFAWVVAAAVRSPETAVTELPLLSPDEQGALLQAGESQFRFSGPECLHELFEVQARRTPRQLAAADSDGALSYSELDAAAECAADLLSRLDAPAGAPASPPMVALLLEAGVPLVTMLFGAFKAGWSVQPLDPDDPIDRLVLAVEECGPAAVVTHAAWLDKAMALAARSGGPRHVILVDGHDFVLHGPHELAAASVRPRERAADPDRVAYVICTSGTTGRPKAVPITHRNVAPLMYWQRDAFPLDERVRTLQTLSVAFDFGLQEILTTLLFGGSWYAFPGRTRRDLRSHVELQRRLGVSMLYATPSFCDAMLAADQRPLNHLRIVLLGGEPLPAVLVERLRERLDPECVVWNGYGPTEASINCAMFAVRDGADLRRRAGVTVPIGCPTAQSRLYVLDARMQPVPVGVPGELYIGGPGVARGYYRQPEASAERFVSSPFSPGDVLYRSGDRVRWLADGQLEFLGRLDQQLKVNGYRIELGEVETVLRQFRGVAQVAVVPSPLPHGGGTRLLAALVPAPGEALDAAAVRRHVAGKLPRFAVPDRFVVLDRLPETGNAKLDTAALAHLLSEQLPAPTPAADESPRDEIERAIAFTFCHLLSLEHIGRHENVFDLGAHSLLMTRVHAQLVTKLRREFPIVTLFEHPTVASLAARILGEEAPAESLAGASRQATALRQLRRRLEIRRRHHD